MTDVATITAGLQSLKAAFDIGKALLKLGISAEIKDQIREMSDRILAAQESAIASGQHETALLKQMGELEKQIAELEAWDAEAETYQLTDLQRKGDPRGGIFAYAPKEGTHTSEPTHLICANCYGKRHKAILQYEHRFGATEVLVCQNCDKDLYLVGYRLPSSIGKQKG